MKSDKTEQTEKGGPLYSTFRNAGFNVRSTFVGMSNFKMENHKKYFH